MRKILQSSVKSYTYLSEAHSKELFGAYDIKHQRGFVATTVDEALKCSDKISEEFDVHQYIVKANVFAGGRGKGHFDTGYQGGVQFCNEQDDVSSAASEMLGNTLFTEQTGPDGVLVDSLFIAECLNFEYEKYFAALVSRETGGFVFIASNDGGVEIEEIAKDTPERIIELRIDSRIGPIEQEVKDFGSALEIAAEDLDDFYQLCDRMYTMAMENDLVQVEVNPLVYGEDGILCLDAKLNMDDNALYRQTEEVEKMDFRYLDEKELEAKKYDLEYIALDGNIGCLVNGAGLAMATMDIIQLEGGMPANFLDVGGGATAEQIEAAFKLILSDENVEGVLVNIFGGIMKCDVIAEGIIKACESVDLDVPLVVRLSGTNEERGKKLLDESDLGIVSASDLGEAAKLVVQQLQN